MNALGLLNELQIFGNSPTVASICDQLAVSRAHNVLWTTELPDSAAFMPAAMVATTVNDMVYSQTLLFSAQRKLAQLQLRAWLRSRNVDPDIVI